MSAQVKVKKERITGKAAAPLGALAATAGMGKGTQLALRAKGYASWPVEKRVEFFARTGVSYYSSTLPTPPSLSIAATRS